MVRSAGTNLYVVPSRTMLTSWVAPVAAGAGAGAAAVVGSAAGVCAFFSPPHPANTTDSPATTAGFIIAFQPPSLVEWVVITAPATGFPRDRPACEQVHKIAMHSPARYAARSRVSLPDASRWSRLRPPLPGHGGAVPRAGGRAARLGPGGRPVLGRPRGDLASGPHGADRFRPRLATGR